MAPSAAAPTLIHSMKCVVSPKAVVTELDSHVQVIGRKRTVSSSNSLMLQHSTSVISNGSVPNSPDATTATRSQSLSAVHDHPSPPKVDLLDRQRLHQVNHHAVKNGSHVKANGAAKQLIRLTTPPVSVQTTVGNHKCNPAAAKNGMVANAVSSSTLVSNGAIPANNLGDNHDDTQSASASQCTIS